MAKGRFVEESVNAKQAKVWRTILKYAFRHKWLFLISLFSTMLVTVYDSSFLPVMNAGALQAASTLEIAPVGDISELVIPVTFAFQIHVDFSFQAFCISLGAAVLLRSVLIMATFYCTNILSMKIVTDLRRDSFAKIQELSFSYFDVNSSGWLIARLQNDASAIGDILSWSLNSALWAAFEFTFAIITMLSLRWDFALVIIASIPVVMIITPPFRRKMLKAQRAARASHSIFVANLAESIAGAKTIKTLAIEEPTFKEATDITENVRAKRLKAGLLHSIYSPLLTFISQAMVAVIVFVGLRWMEDETRAVEAATLVLFIGFVSQVYNPVVNLSQLLVEFFESQASAEKLAQLLNQEPEIVDSPAAIEKYGTPRNPKLENYEPIKGIIDYEHVSFTYATGPEVLHDISFHIDEGESVAFVGETGSGKTTLASLLLRFYEIKQGSIKIDGIDIREKTQAYLRSNVAYVSQTPHVFSGSFYDNIAYGKPGATLEEVKNAAKAVGLDEFISATKQGYMTFLESGGDMLSVGQKQLISFARALLRDPALLILDEATSSIDSESERMVSRCYDTLLRGRTSIIIAHRLSTIVGCDKIYLLDKGRIVESGTHEELMNLNGGYHDLYLTQFQGLTIDEQIKRYGGQEE